MHLPIPADYKNKPKKVIAALKKHVMGQLNL